MKRCARCEREIAEWATSCIECDDLELGAAPPVEATAPPAASIVRPAMATPAQLAPPSTPPALPTVPHVTAPTAPPVAAAARIPAVRTPPAVPSHSPGSLPTSVPLPTTLAERMAARRVSAVPAMAVPPVQATDQVADEYEYAADIVAAADFDASIATPASSPTDFDVTAAPEFAQQVAAPVIPPPASKTAPSSSSHRRMALAALLVVAGGSLSYAMLRSSAPAVPVAAPAAARKPAAPKPVPPKPAASAPAARPATYLHLAVAPAPVPAQCEARAGRRSRTRAGRAARAGVPAVASKWNANNRDWLLNSKKGVAFELRSLKKVGIWQGIAQPVLVVRCDAGRMQTFVYTASAIQMEAVDENHTVRVSFDGEPEATERWADSPEHDALFAPDGAAFAKRLMTAQTLKVSYTPHNALRAVAEFQTYGLSELISPRRSSVGGRNDVGARSWELEGPTRTDDSD